MYYVYDISQNDSNVNVYVSVHVRCVHLLNFHRRFWY